jgi:pyruvate-formate lyase-activating enzyme
VQTPWLRAGRFWLGPAGANLRVLSEDAKQLELTGSLSRAIQDGRFHDSALTTAARFNPMLAELLEALQRGPTEPVSRAALLRGTGFHTLFVELTARCNERCQHCYADAAPERTESLSAEVVRGVVEAAARLEFQRVQLTGGDPLLAPTLLEAVALARRLRIPEVEIYTNGLALTSTLLRELLPHAPSFAFSVYAADPERHDAITRVAGSHTRTLRALSMCLEAGLGVRVGATLMADTLDQREPLRALLIGCGVAADGIGFVTSHAVGRGDFVPGTNDAGQHGGGSLGAGKAAVLSDGSIVPCIFARDVLLGSVLQARLDDVLTAPIPLTAAPEDLDQHLAACATKLSCGECRIRAALLSPEGPPPQRLLVLGRRA